MQRRFSKALCVAYQQSFPPSTTLHGTLRHVLKPDKRFETEKFNQSVDSIDPFSGCRRRQLINTNAILAKGNTPFATVETQSK